MNVKICLLSLGRGMRSRTTEIDVNQSVLTFEGGARGGAVLVCLRVPMSMMLLPSEQFQSGLDVFGHYILCIADGAGRRRTALPLRFKFLLTDSVHIVIQGFSAIAVLNLEAIALISLASAT